MGDFDVFSALKVAIVHPEFKDVAGTKIFGLVASQVEQSSAGLVDVVIKKYTLCYSFVKKGATQEDRAIPAMEVTGMTWRDDLDALGKISTSTQVFA